MEPNESEGAVPSQLRVAAAIPVLILVLLLPALLWMPRVALAQDESDDREGWFTEDQAQRGQESYLEHCAKCHSRDLNARSTYISLYGYPSLKGAYFMDRWEGENVRTLFQVVRHTMPLDAPASLDADTYAEIVAYILQENDFPAGERELPHERDDPDLLSSFVMEPAAKVERPQAQEPEATELQPEDEARQPQAPPSQEEGQAEPSEEAARQAPEDDRWYTETQALRGQDQFMEHCARCHGRSLQGVGVAPSLAGANFIARWEGESVGELFRIASSLMPLDGPGELDPATYADLLAFILWENGFPDGDGELAADYDYLQQLPISAELAEVPEVD